LLTTTAADNDLRVTLPSTQNIQQVHNKLTTTYNFNSIIKYSN
jgi:hypothetical protein